MSVDRYTKTILTVIAICLMWLSLGGPALLPTARAQSSERVVLAGWVDQDGTVRSLPKPYPTPAAAPVALPIWQSNQ